MSLLGSDATARLLGSAGTQETIHLRGITWDHPRAVDSIHAASEAFSRKHPAIHLEWTARPLHQFEDAPLEELAGDFDVLAIDHPFIGEAALSRAITPLGDLIGADTLEARSGEYIGRSFESYQWNGALWALPVDAACMVGAYREDQSREGIPTHWSDIVPFVRRLGRERAVLAANPTHLWGTFLSLCEAVATAEAEKSGVRQVNWWEDAGFDTAVAMAAIDTLREVVDAVAERSLRFDPVNVLEELAGGGDAVYTPLVFGYSTYALSRRGYAVVTFCEAPTVGHGVTGSLTGGVGLAISAQSQHQREAADFVLFSTAAEVQRGIYAEAGGQPASSSAWLSHSVDLRTHGFFSNTLGTMRHSFLRPRVPGYPAFQKQAAHALHDLIVDRVPADRISGTLNRMWGRVDHG